MGFGVNELITDTSKKNEAAKNLIRRFNFQSTMILQTSTDNENGTDAKSTARSEPEEEENVAKHVRLLRMRYS